MTQAQDDLPQSEILIDPVYPAWEDVIIRRQKPSVEVRSEVLDSWRRCLDLGLDPDGGQRLPVLSPRKLTARLKAHQELLDTAGPMMAMVEISVRGTGFIVTLADQEGYVLQVAGDAATLEMARLTNYSPGCCRKEDYAGTNAIGLCLITGGPVQLTGAEHFNRRHHCWTCSSA
ncbi:MAG: hypothetical protein JRJ59_08970, partial [Deltaproteobacteria bacterium]|nr:hypothetical protein [Deltaproteobacteria bacterium]